MKRSLASFVGASVVALAVLLSIASTNGGGGDGDSQCGALAEDLGAEGEPCEDRDQCNEVCCVCDNTGAVFVAQGCDLEVGVCLGGDALCSEALEDDPTLCEPAPGGGDGATDGGP